jgi:DNA primase
LSGETLRLALILVTLCRYPALIDDFEDRIERLEPADPAIGALALFLLGTSSGIVPRCATKSLKMATFRPLKAWRRRAICGSRRFCRTWATISTAARTCLEEELSKQAAAQAWQSELNEATHDLAENAIEEDSTLAFR